MCGCLFSRYLKTLISKIPSPIATTKKTNIHKMEMIGNPLGLISESKGDESAEVPFRLRAMVSTIRPSTSSMIAAESTMVPTLLFSLPSSRRVSTVIPTLVAVMMTPMKRQPKRFSVPKKSTAMPNPIPRGSNTPPSAMRKETSPVFFRSLRSVSSPAVNMTNITPTSAKALSILFSLSGKIQLSGISKNNPHIAGPMINPARMYPRTCGRPIFLINMPSILAENSITASWNKKSIVSICIKFTSYLIAVKYQRSSSAFISPFSPTTATFPNPAAFSDETISSAPCAYSKKLSSSRLYAFPSL